MVTAPNNAGCLVVVARAAHPRRRAPEAAARHPDPARSFSAAAAEELAQQFVRAIELRANVQRNEEAIRAERRQLAVDATPASPAAE